ncbi:MAG: hypothetical protein QXD64_08735 [Thermoplasmata archaeon]
MEREIIKVLEAVPEVPSSAVALIIIVYSTFWESPERESSVSSNSNFVSYSQPVDVYIQAWISWYA